MEVGAGFPVHHGGRLPRYVPIADYQVGLLPIRIRIEYVSAMQRISVAAHVLRPPCLQPRGERQGFFFGSMSYSSGMVVHRTISAGVHRSSVS